MRLVTDEGIFADPALETHMAKVVASLTRPGPGGSFLGLIDGADEDEMYLQAAGAALDDGYNFIVEYRAGDPRRHFRAARKVTATELVTMLVGYLHRREGDWGKSVIWERVDLEQEHADQIRQADQAGVVGELRVQHRAHVNTFLGTALGARTDLGDSDERILSDCAETLRLIRAAKQSPPTMENLRTLLEGIGAVTDGPPK
jgi:hypothetical protein